MGRRERGLSLGKKVLVAFLSLSLSFPWPSLLQANTPEYIAVLELHQRGTKADHTRKMTDRFREELSRYRNLKVLSRDDSKNILEYKKSAIF